jgi:hypothetical protein
LVGKPESNRPLGRLRRRWKDNIRADLWEIADEAVDRIHLAQDGDQWRALAKANEPSWNYMTS